MISECYVFIDGVVPKPLICGRVQLDSASGTGYFVYGKSYLQHPKAFALDPVNLPLSAQTYVTRNNRGVFGVLADAGPDAWGKKVILSLHTTKPQNELEYLLAGAGEGVGALMFSLSRHTSKRKRSKNKLSDINQLIATKDAILNDQAISNEAKKAFEFGQSMGGARPKTLVADGGKLYIAKFNRQDDLFNVVRAEHAAMKMAAELGIETANHKLVATPHGDVLLVERFDADDARVHQHFLSAHSLLNAVKLTETATQSSYSYGQLAEFIRHKTARPEQAQELFLRMVFNVLIGNTDDHSRNHAFLYSFTDQSWSLSPAYDITPVNNHRQHGLGIGKQGRLGTIENLRSQAYRFGVGATKANNIIQQVTEVVAEWPAFFKQAADVSDMDLQRLQGVIPALN